MKFQTTTALGLFALPLALADDGQGSNCIKITGDSAYSWKPDGDFAGEGGQIDSQTHCFGPGSGGISFGAPDAPKGASGNTRLECHFPQSETDADFYNCNLSLVDGFSAAVTCSVAGGGWPNSKVPAAPLGCGYNLMDSCPKEAYDDTCKCCKNFKGASVGSLDAVDPAFQKCKVSDDNPNSAELYHNMEGAYKFQKSDFPLWCTVTPGMKVKEKRAVDEHHEQHARRHIAAAASPHQHQERMGAGPLHTRAVKARPVGDMISS